MIWSKENKLQTIYFSRRVEESYSDFHLIYTNMGDLHTTDARRCFSYVGRTDGNGTDGNGNGQVVNLGSEECLTVGKILHETLHGLG